MVSSLVWVGWLTCSSLPPLPRALVRLAQRHLRRGRLHVRSLRPDDGPDDELPGGLRTSASASAASVSASADFDGRTAPCLVPLSRSRGTTLSSTPTGPSTSSSLSSSSHRCSISCITMNSSAGTSSHVIPLLHSTSKLTPLLSQLGRPAHDPPHPPPGQGSLLRARHAPPAPLRSPARLDPVRPGPDRLRPNGHVRDPAVLPPAQLRLAPARAQVRVARDGADRVHLRDRGQAQRPRLAHRHLVRASDGPAQDHGLVHPLLLDRAHWVSRWL